MRVSTEYAGHRKVAVMGKDLEQRLELLEVLTEEEYQRLSCQSNQEPEANEEMPLAA